MSTLACILHDLGHTVVGYDDHAGWKFTQAGLEARGIKVFYDSDHPLAPGTIVTYSKALCDDHPEIVRARAAELEFTEYNQVLGQLTGQFHTIAVSGAHGKTTTTSLIAHIIPGCNYFIGDGTGHAERGNDVFVIEADEFNRHFLAYHPELAVITNIELDHVECYDGLSDYMAAFEQFGNKAKLVVACGDDDNVRAIDFQVPVLYFGFGETNDIVARNVVLGKDGTSFDCYISGEFFGAFTMPVAGEHMALDALAAIAACHYRGLAAAEIAAGMVTYVTAKRRFKESFFGSVVSIDDYAHHPTELRVTLNTARLKYPDKQVVAVFLPNTYSRTQALMSDFVDVLKTADKAYVMDIECDRERAEDYPGVTSDTLIGLVPGAEKVSVESVEKLLRHKDSVICFMSCADIAPIKDAFDKMAASANV